MRPPLRVIKLGGSLLDWPRWPMELRAWLQAQPPAANVLVVGGGALVDALRQWDQLQQLDSKAMHWLAIDAMSLTARLAAELLGAARLVAAVEDVRRSEPGLQILDVRQFMDDDSRTPDPLSEDWRTTSDSIAARVAARLEADELVLLKSAACVEPAELHALAAAGYVDDNFPTAAAGLAVRFVCLRTKEAGAVVGPPR